MGGRPGDGVVEEGFDFAQGFGLEVAVFFGGGEHVPPGGEGVQLDSDFVHGGFGLGEDAVVEDDEGIGADLAGGADGVDEIDLALGVGGMCGMAGFRSGTCSRMRRCGLLPLP